MTPRERRMAVIDAVAAAHGVTRDDILGKCRVPKIVRARDEVIYRLRTERRYSLQRIAELMGRDDHTTVWAALNRERKRAINNDSRRRRNAEARV